MAAPMRFAISTLREKPDFADIIADRCWHAWWQDSEVTHLEYRSWVEECTQDRGIPSCFVAHEGPTYLGSTSLIADDLSSRPHHTPWIAALWVEPPYRQQGIAAALIDKATAAAGGLGVVKIYLCATSEKTPFYLKRGFTVVEEAVEGMTVFARAIA